MREGLLEAPVRRQPATKLLAPSERSLMYLEMRAHTKHAAFSTATAAVLTPPSHHSGVQHSTQTL